MRLLLLTVLLSSVAVAQPATPDGTDEAPSDTTIAAAAAPFFTFAALADSVRASARLAAPAPAEVVEVIVPTPTMHVIGTGGVTFLAPIGWDGPTSATEEQGYSLYTAVNENGEDELAGVRVRVERIMGLNPLLRERFGRGQTTYGYHGTHPIGPAAVRRGFGIEVEGPGTGGAVAFLERGPALWTVSVQAPTATWATHRADVLALLSAVRIP